MIEWMFSPRPWTSVHKLTNCSSAGEGCDGGGKGGVACRWSRSMVGSQTAWVGGTEREREGEIIIILA